MGESLENVALLVRPLAPLGRGDLPRTRNPYHAYLDGLAASSRPTQRSSLTQIAGLFGVRDPARMPWAALRYEHTNALRSWALAALAPATAARYVGAVKRILQEAYRLEQIGRDDYERAIDLQPIDVQALKARRMALTAAEIASMFELASSCPSRELGLRDAAIFALLFGAGLRVSEAAAAKWHHVDLDSGTPAIAVYGKRRKWRRVGLPAGSVAALEHWRTVHPDPSPHSYILVPDHYRPSLAARLRIFPAGSVAITTRAIFDRVVWYAEECEIPRCTPHDLRRALGAHYLDAGVDLAIVQRALGHASAATTAKHYDPRPELAALRAGSRILVPFVAPNSSASSTPASES